MKLFGKHYGTERFFIMIFLCLAIIISMFVYGGKIYSDTRKVTIASTPMYTSSYKWSRTSATGSVVSLIADRSKTKVFMLIKNDAFTSFDARDYEVFYTNLYRDSEERINDPALTIYSYGASGYVGFYFTDAKGFGNQVLNIYIRNDSAASQMANDNTLDPDMVHDQSFIDHNQIQIIANFGATGIQTSDVFDGANVNQLKLFANTAGTLSDGTKVTESFDRYVSSANETLTNMTQARLKYEQYAENLRQMKIVVPDVPYYIANDKIDTIPVNFDKEPAMFDKGMIREEDDFLGGSLLVSDNENTESGGESSGAVQDEVSETGAAEGAVDENGIKYNYYHTDCMTPGSVSLDYQGKLLSDGFISQTDFYKNMTNPDPLTAYDSYAVWRDECAALYGDKMKSGIKYDSWRKNDGSYVDMSDSDMSGAPIVIENYMTALNEYISYKNKYYEYMDDILELEHKLFMLGQNTTIHSGTGDLKSIWVY